MRYDGVKYESLHGARGEHHGELERCEHRDEQLELHGHHDEPQCDVGLRRDECHARKHDEEHQHGEYHEPLCGVGQHSEPHVHLHGVEQQCGGYHASRCGEARHDECRVLGHDGYHEHQCGEVPQHSEYRANQCDVEQRDEHQCGGHQCDEELHGVHRGGQSDE